MMERKIGYVVIGRNEGARLDACLRSLPQTRAALVYADSASTDESVAIARAAGAQIVRLAGPPLTAARGRNAGFEHLIAAAPETEYVMFVDGDSALEAGWPSVAASFLASRPDVAAVSGDVAELFPDRSIYNRLCDIEWQAPPGETTACGGIAMMRVAAVRQSGGFDIRLRGGEEPELCLRMREAEWKIWRLGAPMARHDAAIASFGQWFSRMKRGGRAFAEVSWMHRASPARIWRYEAIRALGWALVLPASLTAAILVHPAALALLGLYPLQVLRLGLAPTGLPGKARNHALHWAFFVTIAKFAEAAGVLEFALSRLRITPSAAAKAGAATTHEQGG